MRHSTAIILVIVGFSPATVLAHKQQSELIEELIACACLQQIIGFAEATTEGAVKYEDIRAPVLMHVREHVVDYDFELSSNFAYVLDSDDNDVNYLFASRLEGEPPTGIEDTRSLQLELCSIRASIAVHWK